MYLISAFVLSFEVFHGVASYGRQYQGDNILGINCSLDCVRKVARSRAS